MGLRHLRGAVWAVCLGAVALAAALQQAGAEEQEVEEVLVVGKEPDGTWSYHGLGDYCSMFSPGQEPPWCGGDDEHVGGPGEQDYAGVQPCSGTEDVGATCQCTGSATPQKVYNQDAGKFYCRSAPPNGPCPLWGNDFDYDPGVWKCVPKPAGEYMGKIKDCLPPGNIPAAYWGQVPYFRWNNNLKDAGGQPVLGTTYVSGSSIVGIEFNYSNMVASAPGADMSVSDAANLMIHDELIHVRDVVVYGGPNAWEQPGIEAEMEEDGSYGGRPFSKADYENFTFRRALGETTPREGGGLGMKPAAGCLGKW